MIIAEIGQAHDGSLGMAHSFIDAFADTGVDAIKFQTHIAEAESSTFEKFRINFSYEDKTRYDYWKRMEFTENQWISLKKHCDEKNVEFISSPFSVKAVELLEKIGVKRYKIGSGEVNNYLMLHAIKKTKKPIILSSGMSSLDEIQETINFLNKSNKDISVLHCTTSYPTIPKDWNLFEIPKMIKKFNCDIGFSDHSGNIFACLAATSLGAKILEFHVTFDKFMFGPDSSSSLTIDQVKNLVIGVNQIKESLKKSESKNIKNISTLKDMFGKSLCVNKKLFKGHKITFNDLESKKPGKMGIPAKDFESIIGMKLNSNLEKWDFLNIKNLSK